MYFRVTLPPTLLSRLAFAIVVGLIANPALAQTIKGTATYRERMALPPAAVFEATIEDVSRADAPAKPAPPPSEKREATLVFQTGGRVSGFDGCNTLTGGYTLKDNDGISFGQMGATQKACLDSPETERGFRAALKSASRWRIDGGRLELFDAAGARVAAFAARSQASPPTPRRSRGPGGSWSGFRAATERR